MSISYTEKYELKIQGYCVAMVKLQNREVAARVLNVMA